MGWTASGSIQLSRDWQYTEPIAEGSYFRLKHTEAPNGGLFAIAQCEVDSDGKLSIGDSQVLAVEKGISDIVKLPKTAYTDRRIAIKKITSQPNLEQEIRRLILPNLLAPIEQEINYIRRNNWKVDIEVSDYAEVVGTDYTDRFTAIDTKLSTIEQKISSNSSSTPAPSNTKTLTYQSDGDTNGVCYWIGTNYGTEAWVNPHAAERVVVSKSGASNADLNFVERMVDRIANDVGTNNQPNSWIKIDLGITNKLTINYYSLRGRTGQYNDNYPRNWKLQGSNDNSSWIDLDTQSNNIAISGQGIWVSIPVSNQAVGYRYLQILQTGLTSSDASFLSLGEFEFYGTLTRS